MSRGVPASCTQRRNKSFPNEKCWCSLWMMRQMMPSRDRARDSDSIVAKGLLTLRPTESRGRPPARIVLDQSGTESAALGREASQVHEVLDVSRVEEFQMAEIGRSRFVDGVGIEAIAVGKRPAYAIGRRPQCACSNLSTELTETGFPPAIHRGT